VSLTGVASLKRASVLRRPRIRPNIDAAFPLLPTAAMSPLL
jgi:hypothetical protein